MNLTPHFVIKYESMGTNIDSISITILCFQCHYVRIVCTKEQLNIQTNEEDKLRNRFMDVFLMEQ